MIVDSSALVEIFKGQPERERCIRALADPRPKSMSAANYLEAALVVNNMDGAPQSDPLERIISEFQIAVVPVTLEHVQIARAAHRIYGKGIHAKARLNFGDCFAYALARERNEPLLFVGDDFAHTDIRPALDPA